MSDYTNKSKPLLERIAQMLGKSAWQPVYGAGGAYGGLTVQDISAAVGAARQRNDAGVQMPGCVRSEILLLHYAGRTDLILQIAKACWNAICKGVKKEDVAIGRTACWLAAESLGGRQITQDILKQEAWVLCRNYEALEHEMGYALAWMNGEKFEAEEAFKAFLRDREEVTARRLKKAS